MIPVYPQFPLDKSLNISIIMKAEDVRASIQEKKKERKEKNTERLKGKKGERKEGRKEERKKGRKEGRKEGTRMDTGQHEQKMILNKD